MIKEILEIIFSFVQHSLIPLGGLGVFWATFIAQIVPPISTPILVITSGILFLPENISGLFFKNLFLIIALPAAAGVTIGSLTIYYLGYFLGKPFLEKWGRFLKLSWSDVEKLERKFDKGYWDEAVLFGLRVFPILPTVSVSLSCGLIRLKLRTYLIFTFLGTFVKVLILAPLGWQASVFYLSHPSLFRDVEKIGLFVILAIIFILFFYHIRRKRKNNNQLKNGRLQETNK